MTAVLSESAALRSRVHRRMSDGQRGKRGLEVHLQERAYGVPALIEVDGDWCARPAAAVNLEILRDRHDGEDFGILQRTIGRKRIFESLELDRRQGVKGINDTAGGRRLIKVNERDGQP